MNDVAEGEFKIVFTGPMGAGKTTAIAAISEIDPVRTEVANNDRMSHEKASTTVGFDYGRITLPGGGVVRLYGTPGQPRFRFMWSIVGRGAAGAIVLLDATQPGALVQMDLFVDAFRPLVPEGALVVGVGRTTEEGALNSDTFASRLEARGILAPVLSVDVRRKADVMLLVQTLACILETQNGNAYA
ncbi:GTP-binding protein [Dokdonella sp. MW10]|uniref:GTP-binding protein n=1 Tax=Dokdonella sp. MW10 TaxID=2992926 RepID=UPI003F802979